MTLATEPHLTQHDIASLSHEEIANMPATELIRLITLAPTTANYEESRLPFMSRTTLERLAHLAKYACRSEA